MRIVVTGSAGHLGEGLARSLRGAGHEVVGLDLLASPWTDVVGSVTDRPVVREVVAGADAVLHAATLHKPHVISHTKQDFVDTNVTGTLNVLEEAVAAGVSRVVFTSSTTTFGRTLVPPPGAPAAWITEGVVPAVKNVYGATKVAAEELCELVHREHGLAVLVLRTARFFPEADDRSDVRERYDDTNLKVNELLYRRADLEDVVAAHVLALEKAPEVGFDRLVISATTPFTPEDLTQLRVDAPAVVARRVPGYEEVYAQRGWRMLDAIERVYVNGRAREVLGWAPRFDFAHAIDRLRVGQPWGSELARRVGAKGYRAESAGVIGRR